MPNCGHREAVCVIGDFWTCKVGGCKNGPEIKSTGAFERLRATAFKGQREFLDLEWDEQKTPVTSAVQKVSIRFSQIRGFHRLYLQATNSFDTFAELTWAPTTGEWLVSAEPGYFVGFSQQPHSNHLSFADDGSKEISFYWRRA